MRQVQECQSGQECTAPSKPRTFSLPGIPGSPPRPPSRSVGCGRGSRRMHHSVGNAQTLSHPHREFDDLSTAQYSWEFLALQQCAAIRQSTILPTNESQATILVLRWLAHENMASRNRQRGSYVYGEDSSEVFSTDHEAAKQRQATVYDAVAGRDDLPRRFRAQALVARDN